ncbi:MAG: hypothetical protein NTY93_01075 [Candidatus Kaiserbacteria bacterium]|nr:hypothetical protein [Candidatus Kaiserbacteria bacterium]
MPNIVVVGRSSVSVGDISRIVTQLGINEADGVITCPCQYQYPLCCVDMTERHNESPYLIVRDTDENEAMRIAHALNRGLKIDVEVEILRAFLPRKK